MKELVQLAQNVTKAVSPIVPFPISFSDKDGYLVGTTDDKRIGTFHKEYKNVDNKGEFIVYEESEVSHMDNVLRSEEHTSELQSRFDLVCRLLLEKKQMWYPLSLP